MSARVLNKNSLALCRARAKISSGCEADSFRVIAGPWRCWLLLITWNAALLGVGCSKCLGTLKGQNIVAEPKSALKILYSLPKRCAVSPRMKSSAGWALHNLGHHADHRLWKPGEVMPSRVCSAQSIQSKLRQKGCYDSNPEIFNQLIMIFISWLVIENMYIFIYIFLYILKWYFGYMELNEIYYLFHLFLFTFFKCDY